MTDKEGLTTAEAEVIKQQARIIELQEKRGRQYVAERERLLHVIRVALEKIGELDGVETNLDNYPTSEGRVVTINIRLPNVNT